MANLSMSTKFQQACLFFLLLPSLVFAKALTPVSLQLKWLHQFQFAGYYMALEKGFYEDVGIDVTLVERVVGESPLNSMLEKSTQFAITDVGALIYRSSGVPLVSLAAIFQHSPAVLLVRKDANVHALADLRGKNIRNSLGFNNAELLAMFERSGMPITETNLYSTDQSLESFISGEVIGINAYTTNEPYRLKKRGIEFDTFYPKDYGVDFYGDLLITTEFMIENEPQLVKDFLEASLKGWKYSLNNIDESIDVILERYNSQSKTRDELEFEAKELSKLILHNVVPIGYMNSQRWMSILKVFEEQDKLLGKVDIGEFIYASDLNDSRFIDFFKLYYRELASLGAALMVLVLVLNNLRLRSLVKRAVADLESRKRSAEIDARTDPLTQMPNRRHFFEVLDRDIAYAKRKKHMLVVAMADIDDFKVINDTYGHFEGDKVLNHIGRLFNKEARTSDFHARLGGEEFVIILRDTTLLDAKKVIERLRVSVIENGYQIDHRDLPLTMSFGVASLNSDDTAQTLLRRADEAMYEAKRSGKNKVVLRAV